MNYPEGIGLSGSGAIYAQIVVFKNASSTMVKQVFYDQQTTKEYTRSYANNAWQSWQRIATSDDINELSGGDTDGWVTTPLLSFNTGNDLYYRIKNGVLYMRLYAAPSGPLVASTNTVLWNIPPEIASRMPQVNFTYSVPNAMGGNNATNQPTFSINYEAATSTIKVYNDIAVTTGHRLAFMIPVPLD